MEHREGANDISNSKREQKSVSKSSSRKDDSTQESKQREKKPTLAIYKPPGSRLTNEPTNKSSTEKELAKTVKDSQETTSSKAKEANRRPHNPPKNQSHHESATEPKRQSNEHQQPKPHIAKNGKHKQTTPRLENTIAQTSTTVDSVVTESKPTSTKTNSHKYSANRDNRREKKREEPPTTKNASSSSSSSRKSVDIDLEEYLNNGSTSNLQQLNAPIQSHRTQASPHGSGLLKLNKSTFNQIISASHHRDEADILHSNDDLSRRNGRSREEAHKDELLYQHEGQQGGGGGRGNFKTLFNPNDPSKPILVRSNMSSNANYRMSTTVASNDSFKSTSSQVQSKQHQHLSNFEVAPKSRNKQLVDKTMSIVHAIEPVEQELKSLIENNYDIAMSYENYSTSINSLRKQYEKLFIEAAFTHIETATNVNLDSNHWRTCYHSLIETLRKVYNARRVMPVAAALTELIGEGTVFYRSLIERLEKTFLHFKVDDLINFKYLNLSKISNTSNSMEIKTKDMKLALLLISRCFIYLGDLARYKELIFAPTSDSESTQCDRDYSLARTFYLKSMLLAPKVARSYNQLAVVAVYTKKRLDAVYYYFRALEVNTAMVSARQQLVTLFEEARLKSEQILRMINATKQKKQKSRAEAAATATTTRVATKSGRVELWIRPVLSDTSKQQQDRKQQQQHACSDSDNDDNEDDEDADEDDDEDEQDAYDDGHQRQAKSICTNDKKLSVYELSKRFMVNYLNTVGKLFTKVGMENYDEMASITLHENPWRKKLSLLF